MGRHVALLRGINVGGTRKLPMARLREICAGLGWAEVATYIQSGNVIFSADGGAAALEQALAGEAIRRVGDALWIHYPAGAGTTKITPSLLDRAAGSPVTARNWRTVVTLREMLDA